MPLANNILFKIGMAAALAIMPASFDGLASYYSTKGCLGCNQNLVMANGAKLNDEVISVAFNRAPLNTILIITNKDNGITIEAPVTDRGGFERHGKIIDLNLAAKEALGCGSTCKVSIKIK